MCFKFINYYCVYCIILKKPDDDFYLKLITNFTFKGNLPVLLIKVY